VSEVAVVSLDEVGELATEAQGDEQVGPHTRHPGRLLADVEGVEQPEPGVVLAPAVPGEDGAVVAVGDVEQAVLRRRDHRTAGGGFSAQAVGGALDRRIDDVVCRGLDEAVR
jgi:hypothetical protein